jgi:hypothetical protein
MMIMTIEVNRRSNNSDNDNDINIPDPPWFFLIFQTGAELCKVVVYPALIGHAFDLYAIT